MHTLMKKQQLLKYPMLAYRDKIYLCVITRLQSMWIVTFLQLFDISKYSFMLSKKLLLND